jgi:hypothetical protein
MNIPVAKSYTFCSEIRNELPLVSSCIIGRNSDNGLGAFFVGAKFISVFTAIMITSY